MQNLVKKLIQLSVCFFLVLGLSNLLAQQSQEPLLDEIKKKPGVKVLKTQENLLIEGEIFNRKDYQQVLLYLKLFPKKTYLLVKPASGIVESLIEQVQTAFQRKSIYGLKIENSGNRFFLRGHASSKESLTSALEIGRIIIPNLENEVETPVKTDPTVSMRVQILEITKRAHEKLGLSWPVRTKDAFAVTPNNILSMPQWLVSLEHLSSTGHARLLAEPMLVVKNGSTAKLQAGGQIPLRITGIFQNKIMWKHYGLTIHIQVKSITGNLIRTHITSESSHLDEATAVDGIPGIRSNEMSTEIDVREGSPVLLTGLFYSSASKDIEQLPLLGNIPILGELFKSRNYRDNESELLIALLPRLEYPEAQLPLKTKRVE